MRIPLEDNYEDILQKAARGWGLDLATLSQRSGLARDVVERAMAGHFDEAAARALAPILALDAQALVAIGRRAWAPAPVGLPGLTLFSTPFRDMRVNAWIVHDTVSRDALIFDTGTDSAPLLAHLRENSLTARALFLTHGHADHVAALSDLRRALPSMPCYRPTGEAVAGAAPLAGEGTMQAGVFQIEIRSTPGHSPDGLTYFFLLGDRPVAVVGDALFAGSMGGASNDWQRALVAIQDRILSLPANTLLCPGHGPPTTVAEERVHNPFHANPRRWNLSDR